MKNSMNVFLKIRVVSFRTLLFILVATKATTSIAQDKLYPNEFPLGDVKLTNGPFKSAQDLNTTTILKYNIDRLLAPYRKEAGLTPKGESFVNWIGLDGHIGGHYLSALAMNYAATGNATSKQRMDYMVSELLICQNANAGDANFVGYVGGVPDSKAIFTRFKNKDASVYWAGWVPWYNLHKTYAGLRDAYVYGGNATAKSIFLKFCDWAIVLLAGYNDSNMAGLMGNEHGGMNEIFVDAYQMTNDVKYLTMAKKFSHKDLLNNMANRNDNLDDKHANTQVPKAVGFQRIAELGNDNTYRAAATFFWETVTGKRSLALGGNSLKEFFPKASACGGYTTEREGPESCNSNNMLKLTEGLFRMKPEAKYADYFERTIFNHILSTQHPTHGGYVYFTPARPRHYRVYSAPNSAMWCCVGTGMENHMKYGQFVYTRRNDSLYVNLFVASELNWRDKGVSLKQETTFPNEERTKLTITASSSAFKLFVRHPSWVPANKLKVLVGTDTLALTSLPSSYVYVNKNLKAGDVVTVLLPMRATTEQLINVPNYLAFMYGPILLGAKTGTESLNGLVADDGRWAHIAGGPLQGLDQAPVVVSNVAAAASKVVKVKNQPMTFKVPVLFNGKTDSLTLQPFYKIHDARYMMYWITLTSDQYKKIMDSLALAENKSLQLDQRTVDKVTPGQQQPEVDHSMKSSNSTKGTSQNEFYRDANNGYFSYNLLTNKETNLSLMVRYWGNETGSRTFNITVDGVKLVTENITGKWNINDFVNVEYPLPNSMVQGKDSIRVAFVAAINNTAGGVFDVRILRKSNSPGEMVLNGEFDLGTTNWNIQNFSGAAGTMSVVNNTNMSGPNALKVCPTTPGTIDWNIQLQQNTPVTAGKSYVMSFDAKADANRNITAAVQQNPSPYIFHLQQSLSLTNSTKSFSYTFTPTLSDPDANIKFFLGASTSCVYIDKVSLKESLVVTGMEDEDTENSFLVFPNPFDAAFIIDVKDEYNYQLFDASGSELINGKASGRTTLGQNLQNGIYLLVIRNEKGSKTIKLHKR
ncbi:MAG: glycoside hydrolase family 127 protein [Opitutaceae bacterium]|nr:glycoside hydrolase family 127 protein [Cytophagales bacterium]